jgi:Flp pilus assembly pilin Flp
MLNHLRSVVRRDEAGQTNMEFGLIVSLIGVALIGVLLIVGGEIRTDFTEIKDKLLEVL